MPLVLAKEGHGVTLELSRTPNALAQNWQAPATSRETSTWWRPTAGTLSAP
jgi:hypothetical protein